MNFFKAFAPITPPTLRFNLAASDVPLADSCIAIAIKTAGYGLLQRPEEKKILIVLSDGKPYDVIVNRPHAKNPEPYMGKYAVNDTATEVRHLRNLGVSVLGVFAGEEKDLSTEKKIFGKDFAYIRDISNFSRIVGRYLIKQLDSDE